MISSVVSFTLPRRRDSVACPLLQYPDRLLEVKVGILFSIFHAAKFFQKTLWNSWNSMNPFSWRWESDGRRMLRLRSTEIGSVLCVATSTRTSMTSKNTKLPIFTGGRSTIQPLPGPPWPRGTPSGLLSLGVGLLFSLYQNLHDLEEHQAAYFHWG